MIAFCVGVLFALIAQYARLNTFDKIISAALFLDSEVIQILLFAIAVSSVGFFLEYALGGAVVSVKPLYVVGVAAGGLFFGLGVAILGYCPGTMPMALAEGNIDAIVGIAGGILAGAIFTMIYPTILPFIGPDFGAINLYVDTYALSGVIVLVNAGALLFIAAKIVPRLYSGHDQPSPGGPGGGVGRFDRTSVRGQS